MEVTLSVKCLAIGVLQSHITIKAEYMTTKAKSFLQSQVDGQIIKALSNCLPSTVLARNCCRKMRYNKGKWTQEIAEPPHPSTYTALPPSYPLPTLFHPFTTYPIFFLLPNPPPLQPPTVFSSLSKCSPHRKIQMPKSTMLHLSNMSKVEGGGSSFLTHFDAKISLPKFYNFSLTEEI